MLLIPQFTVTTFLLHLQVNFFDDHTKIVLIPGGKHVLVTYIDKNREGTSYLLSEIASQGCTTEMIDRLRYCKRVMKKVWDLVEEERGPDSWRETPDFQLLKKW